METDEIYEVLMLQLLKAINRYDPDYTLKVKLLTEAINIITHDSALKQFNVPDFRDHLDFDCYRHLRMLARNSFIEQILEDGQPAGWVIRSENWPPPKSFHRVGPIGLAYYLQTWFRYNLQQYISKQMSELESKEGVYSLEGIVDSYRRDFAINRGDGKDINSNSSKEFNSEKPRVVSNAWLARERSLASSIDVSTLDLAWVSKTDDTLFAGLSRKERMLLYLVFARELSWKEIGKNFDMGDREAMRWFDRVVSVIQQRIAFYGNGIKEEAA